MFGILKSILKKSLSEEEQKKVVTDFFWDDKFIIKYSNIDTINTIKNKYNIINYESVRKHVIQIFEEYGVKQENIGEFFLKIFIAGIIDFEDLNKLIKWAETYKIKNFPKKIEDLRILEKIDFSDWTYAFEEYSKIYSLPNEICKLKYLKILYLGSMYNPDQIQCELKELPECIGDLKNLEELYLSNQYEIKKLPKSIGKLVNLKKLILFNIDIQLPEEIINLINLNELYLPISFQPSNQQKEWLKKLKDKGCKINDNISTNNEYDPISDINKSLNSLKDKTVSNKYDNLFQLSDEEFEEMVEEPILNKYGIKYIYHMTHYKNLESILKNGLLSHNNELVKQHIDNIEVNDRRNKIEPLYQKNLHTYVPFYFNPKNSMLYVNKEIQKDIVILAFDKTLLLKDQIIFTDGNAATNKTNYYNNLDDLNKLNWTCLNANYWNDFEDGKRERMAEILIPYKVNITRLRKIYCYDEETKSFIQDLDDELDIEISTKLYF